MVLEKKNIAVPVIYSSIKSCLCSNHLHHDTGYKLFCASLHPAFPSQLRSFVRVTGDCIRGKERIGDSE